MSALFISRVTVKDQEKFQTYLQQSKELASQYGAELLASGKAPRTLSGKSSSHQLAVVVKFPSVEALDAWHESEDYQSLIPLRQESSDQEINAYDLVL